MARRAAVLWTLIALAPIWPLLAGNVLLQHDGGLSDWLHSGLGYRVFLGRELASGHVPLWMPDLLSGVPFLPQIEAGALYFVDWPLWAVLDPTAATALSIASAILVSAFGARGLARAHGISGTGATFSGIAYATAGFHLSHLKHHHMHTAAAWIPWALWGLESGLQGNTLAWPGLAMVLGIQAYAGHPQISYYTGLILVARTLAVLVPRWRTAEARRHLLAAAGSALLGGTLASLALLPTWRFNATSMRAAGMDWKAASAFPFWLGDVTTLVLPGLWGSYYDLSWPGAAHGALFWEDWLYLGLLPLGLAILGVRGALPSWAKFWFWTSLLAGLLTAGASLPVYRVFWTLVPGMHLFRFPERFSVVLALGVALLAGRGLMLLVERAPSLKHWVYLVFIVHAVDVTIASRAVIPTGPRSAWDAPRSPLSDAVGEGAVTVIGGMQAWEAAHRAVPRGLPIDMRPFEALARLPMQNAAISWGWRTPDGYTNMVRNSTGRYWALLRFMIPGAPKLAVADRSGVTESYVRLLERAGTTWVFAPSGMAVPGAAPIAEDRGWAVHRLAHPRPRAYVAGSWASYPDVDAAVLRDTPPIVPPDSPPSEGRGDRPANLEEKTTDRLEIAAEGPGLLVVTDSYDPDWTVTVDGAPTPMIVVDGWQRGVWLDGARPHLVVMRYWPAGLTAGMFLALVGAAGCALWTLAALRSARRWPAY